MLHNVQKIREDVTSINSSSSSHQSRTLHLVLGTFVYRWHQSTWRQEAVGCNGAVKELMHQQPSSMP